MPARIPREDLLDELRQLADVKGRAPFQREMNEEGKYSESPYSRRFGCWNEALLEAGLDPNRERNIPDKKLLDEIRRLDELFGRAPTVSEMNSEGKYSTTAYRRFGNWNAALNVAGVSSREPGGVEGELNSGWIDEEGLLSEIQRMAEERGRAPSKKEMNKEGRYHSSTYNRRFDGWIEALERVGLDPKERPSGADHHFWNDSHIEWYGPNWRSQRNQTRERDSNQCRVCGIGEGCNGRKISVHHIRPRSVFIDEANGVYGDVDWESCDDLSNLICLCLLHYNPGIDGRWSELSHVEWEKKAREYFDGKN